MMITAFRTVRSWSQSAIRETGIPEKDISHIFERNFSGGRRIQTSPSGKGNSGLGLYISSQIISQHSGRMSAKNNPDGGAALSFSLPYYR